VVKAKCREVFFKGIDWKVKSKESQEDSESRGADILLVEIVDRNIN